MFTGAASADTQLTEEMKQGGEETKNCGEETENDQQKANVQSEDHPLLEFVPITPPFDVPRFADYISLSLSAPHTFVSAF